MTSLAYTSYGPTAAMDDDDIRQIRAMAELEGACPDAAERRAVKEDRRQRNAWYKFLGKPRNPPLTPEESRRIRDLDIFVQRRLGARVKDLAKSFRLSERQINKIASKVPSSVDIEKIVDPDGWRKRSSDLSKFHAIGTEDVTAKYLDEDSDLRGIYIEALT